MLKVDGATSSEGFLVFSSFGERLQNDSPYAIGWLSVCPVCLSVTLVYCGQTVGWIKMKLGVEVGLGSGHNVLDWDPAALPKRGIAPNFLSMSVVAKRLDGLRCLATLC